MLPSDLTLSALRFILSAKSRQSRKQDCETIDFCNNLQKRLLTNESYSANATLRDNLTDVKTLC